MVIWIIVAEVAFWIAIVIGLIFRYVLKLEKLSLFFFLLTPLIDLALVLLTTVDLQSGTTATTAHGIAAIYIGVSLAYGKSMIAWADEKFQVWFLKKPSTKRTLLGREKGIYELKMWARHVIAYILGSVLLWLMIFYVGLESTEALFNVWRIWSIALIIDGAISLSYILFPKKTA
ncbi:hypothetical protein [Ureibacillus manganicus]|uniref:Membrane protein n=1 Tax=Ureibacillus manganicus DSM 26584 TaxID=1384049 RepID=A0A0A3I7B2_9BACL|nr:hypothetical protein [Ureibacillus manganicus]KGR79395.1 membrane protein [Ureibacillus manganicus DSM 26584]